MRWVITVLAIGVLVLITIGADDDGKSEMRKLVGNWEIVSIEAAGKKAGKGAPEKAVIKDGKATFFAGGKEIPTLKDLKIELDPKKPKEMDLVRGTRERLPCLYQVTEDSLKIAMPLVPKQRKLGESLPRPESFDTKDKPIMVMTAKRSKG